MIKVKFSFVASVGQRKNSASVMGIEGRINRRIKIYDGEICEYVKLMVMTF